MTVSIIKTSAKDIKSQHERINDVENAMVELQEDNIGFKSEVTAQVGSLNSQLAEKANSTDVRIRTVKLGQTDMTDEFLQMMAGNTPINAVVADGGVSTEKLAEKAVTANKTNFLAIGKNLVNPDTNLVGYSLSATTGLAGASTASNTTSDFIEVSPDTDYVFSALLTSAVFITAWSYDASKNVIAGSIVQNQTAYHTHPNAAFVRLHWASSHSNIQFEAGTLKTGYEPYGNKLKKRLPVEGSELRNLSIPKDKIAFKSINVEQLSVIKDGVNLFNKDTRTIGYFINTNMGVLAASATYDTSDYIPVVAGQSYVFSPRIRKLLVFDEQKQPIPSTYVDSTTGYIFTPTVTGFMRVSFYALDVETFQVEKGTVATSYKPYQFTIDYLTFNDKQKNELKSSLLDNADIKIVKSGETFTLTSKFDSTKDISIETIRNGSSNGAFNFKKTTIGTDLIHDNADDITPIRTFYTVGANHGYGVVQITVSGKTSADLGSKWTDGVRVFTLVSVAGNVIQLAPEYSVTDGVVSAEYPTPAADLVHVSGATNTTTIPITGNTIGQLFPSISNISVKYVLDGKEITTDGTYYGKELQIQEKYKILDYKSLLDFYQANIGQSHVVANIEGIVEIANTFMFRKGLKCTTSHSLKVLKKVYLGRCGFLQSVALALTGYTRKRFMPNVKVKSGFDFANGIDLDAYSTSLVFATADYVNPSIPPNHYVDWIYSGTSKKYGFSMGYIIDKTNSKNVDRVTNSPNGWDMRNTKKSYPIAIEGITLNVGSYLTFMGFRNYLSPEEVGNATNLNVVQDKKDVYIYADTNQAEIGLNVGLPEHIGKSIALVQGENITVLNDVVDTNGAVLTATGVANGILKIS